MAQKNHAVAPAIFSEKLIIRMIIGTIVGLAVISFFIFRVPHPRPEWGEMWRVRPLIVTPLMGAMCGAGFHVVTCLFYQRGWQRVFGVVLAVLGCIVGMWMGIILGLHGTMWN